MVLKINWSLISNNSYANERFRGFFLSHLNMLASWHRVGFASDR